MENGETDNSTSPWSEGLFIENRKQEHQWGSALKPLPTAQSTKKTAAYREQEPCPICTLEVCTRVQVLFYRRYPMGLPRLRNKIFPMALVIKLTQIQNMENMTSYVCQPSSQHMDRPPFYTGINRGFFSTFPGYTSPSFSILTRHLPGSRHLSLQTVWSRQNSRFTIGWDWIHSGSLCSIRVAMVTMGLCYLNSWWAWHKGNSCAALSIICQENGREVKR